MHIRYLKNMEGGGGGETRGKRLYRVAYRWHINEICTGNFSF